jgi:hypothetical protein
VSRASDLSPTPRIAAGDGPMNVTPHVMQISANFALSERKP